MVPGKGGGGVGGGGGGWQDGGREYRRGRSWRLSSRTRPWVSRTTALGLEGSLVAATLVVLVVMIVCHNSIRFLEWLGPVCTLKNSLECEAHFGQLPINTE